MNFVKNIISMDVSDYESGSDKLEKLEALLLFIRSGFGPFNSLTPSKQESLLALAYELVLDARCSLSPPVYA